jgi:signal transduction histidine kinase
MPTVDRVSSPTVPAESRPPRQRPPRQRLRRIRSTARQALVDSGYLLIGLPVAVAGFVVMVAGMASGVGGIIVIGPPVLAGTLLAARGFADLERRRIAPVLRTRINRPVYRSAPAGAGRLRRMLNPVTDGRSWLDALHAFLVFPVSVPAFVVTVVWWCAGVGGVTYPAYDWALPHPPESHELPEILGLGRSAAVREQLYFVLGVVFLVTLPLVVRGCALARASLGRVLLSDVAGLRERLEAETATAQARTAAAVSAEASALRRLERDIHDGPQQRLVRLAMDLGRARQHLETDPEVARQAVTEALTQARETLDELRALSRGIAPPILADRGLAAAAAALAGRCTVPVDLAAPDIGRLDPAVENSAYFVIAESLTNVAKHSHATECRVRLDRLGDRLLVSISDDGIGGAHLAKGHGLTGLADRAQAIGGTLAVHSPVGGPTTITAELPWR